MEDRTGQRTNLTSRAAQGHVSWTVPAGTWQVMFFTCVPDGSRGLVDYLDPEAVGRFVSLTYEAYHRQFPRRFGTTIDSAFYDEPTFHWVQGGRAWTEGFNAKFRQRHGYDPVPFYPALWRDIGPETAAARNALFGFRAELYATGFPKTLDDWCRAHKIELTGHADQEEIVNPVGLCGDLMKAFRHQAIPAIDQIFQYGRASKAYKVVSSAAFNYDRPRVLTECYGGIDRMPVANLYKEAMDQFAKGINVMVPHAVWYEPARIVFQPDLSPGSPGYGAELPAFNRYIGRLQLLLQGGRHVADLAVLYPIATLQAGYYFGPGKPYEGGVIPPEADYMDVGDRLALAVRRDFTFLHPDVLEARCGVVGAELRLHNRVNAERYRAFLIPGSRVISARALRQVRRFYDQGGQVIATTRLPDRSAEFGQDAEVRAAILGIFGPVAAGGGSTAGAPHANARGGRAWFVPEPSPAALRAVLDAAVRVWDVQFEPDLAVSGGNLSYIHKVKDGLDLYFLANSSETPVEGWLRLRGSLSLEEWNPHTGQAGPVEHARQRDDGQDVTRVRFNLPPVQSRFLVGKPPGRAATR
jgi:hypothetical protein